MPFQSVPNGVEITLVGQQNNIPVINVWHAEVVSPASLTELLTIAGVVTAWVSSTWVQNMHVSYSVGSVRVRAMDTENSPVVEVPMVAGNVGLGVGVAGAANAAVVASLRTGAAGRSFRGRTYIGALPASVLVTAQTISVASAGVYAQSIVDLIDDLEAVGAVMSVLSRIANGVFRVVGILTEIIEVIVNTNADSQRRRTAN